MKSCLVVDDSKVVRKFARRILEELSFSVTEACDGSEALAECNKVVPNAILLDWNMPVMDGLQFLKEFRKNKDWQNIPVLFCTTVNDVASIKEAMNCGANEYIMKPFDTEIIKNKFIQMGLLS